MTETARKKIRVCCGKTCGPLGGEAIMTALEHAYGLTAGSANDEIDLDFCACRSFCEQGPTVDVDAKTITHATPRTIVHRIARGEGEVLPRESEDFDLDQLLNDLA